ncbi:hypothetical protein MNB_SV-14-1057 [hydrothermal vent metagenome]|uniref:Uncharacterized protein n=1 Tax=hydrothermal vent metagenome TaxID=652676 RepID=A0A1W1BYM2_9ZZZZ
MYKNNIKNRDRRLIDEALASEPIKNTFRLGLEFIKLNKTFTLTAMVIFIVLNIFGMIPVASFIFMVLLGIFALVIQIHIGKIFYESKDIKNYITEIKESSLDKTLTEHIATAFGAYLGWFVLALVLMFFFSLITSSLGIVNEFNGLVILGIPIVIVALFISYIQPLVQANVIMSNGVQEGFKAVFTLFSTRLWHLAFQSSYFKYIAGFGLISILLLFLSSFIMGLLTNLIGIPIIANVLMLILMYIFMIIMAVGSMMAKRIVEA